MPDNYGVKVPMGQIGCVQPSRLVCGGDLIVGSAHDRDRIYVASLMRHYFTDRRITETWKLSEARGVRWLERELGRDDPASWRWGELHCLEPEHALGSKVDSFNLPGWEAPGASASVWKAGFDMGPGDDPFRSTYGPAMVT